MIEYIKNWAFSLCAASVAGSILNMLLPECSMQKTFKTVLGIFFLSSVIIPFTEVEFSDLDKLFSADNISDEIIKSEELEDISAEYLENKIITATEEILKSSNAYAKDIFIKINISENQSIDINKFVLTFDYLDDPEKISEEIYRKTGIKPKIILSGES